MAKKLSTVIFVAVSLFSCAGSMASYKQELLNCVEKSKTLEESKECRKDVDRRWGI